MTNAIKQWQLLEAAVMLLEEPISNWRPHCCWQHNRLGIEHLSRSRLFITSISFNFLQVKQNNLLEFVLSLKVKNKSSQFKP